MNKTSADNTIYDNLGNGFCIGFEDPNPGYRIYKTMPCGHSGLLVNGKWVCQTCWSYEKISGGS